MPRFQPEKIFRELESCAVQYVVIGGLAATLHGSPLRTGDLDICPASDQVNLERLAKALAAMGARIRTADTPEGLVFDVSARFLSSVEILNLMTRWGDLDLSFKPSGTTGYEDLTSRSVSFDLEGLRVPVAALEDVIRSKEAAGREKDRAAIPTLRALLRRKGSS